MAKFIKSMAKNSLSLDSETEKLVKSEVSRLTSRLAFYNSDASTNSLKNA